MKTLLTVLLLTSLFACNAQKASFERINADKLMELSSTKNVELLDVRTPGEVADGYIKGTKLFIDYNSPAFNEQIAALDKSKTYIVYCRSGNRSTKALNAMVDLGFKNLYELQGGITGVTKADYIVK